MDSNDYIGAPAICPLLDIPSDSVTNISCLDGYSLCPQAEYCGTGIRGTPVLWCLKLKEILTAVTKGNQQ